MAEERLKVPSARIAVSILDDEDTLSLFQRGSAGFSALWAFIGLLILAKTMNNRGTFTGKPAKYARKIGMTPAQLEGALSLIADACKENGNEPWIVRSEGSFRIRKWDRWNAGNWGGARDGAGRKPESSGNQDEIKLIPESESRSHLPSSVSSSGSGISKRSPSENTHSPVLPGDAASACVIGEGDAVRLVREEPDAELPPPGLEPSANPGAEDPVPFSLVKRIAEFYPRKVALEEAYPAIEGAVRKVARARGCDIRAAVTLLTARVKAYANSDEGRGDPRYIPFPAKWFSQGRYNDDDGAWRRADASGGTQDTPDAIPAALARVLERGGKA